MTVFVDVDYGNNRLLVRYTYSIDDFDKLKSCKFLRPKNRGKNPHPDESYFYGKLSWETAHELRRVFGDGMELTLECKMWGHRVKAEAELLMSLASAEDAELLLVPDLLPEMYELIDKGMTTSLLGDKKPYNQEDGRPRPFQKADIAFMAARGKSGNFNHQGLGKTIEVIGAIAESDCLFGNNLIACPVVSKESVWGYEWNSWVRDVPIIITPEGRDRRIRAINEALQLREDGYAFTLVVNPAMLKMKSKFRKCGDHKSGDHSVHEMRRCGLCDEFFEPEYPQLFEFEWDWFVMDEIQKMGIYNMSSMTYKALQKVPATNRVAMSGTPFGGKAIHVYHILHLLDPVEFSNKMEFAERWLNVSKNDSRHVPEEKRAFSTVIGELRSCRRHPDLMSDEQNDCPDCNKIRQPFWDMLSTYAIRRTKDIYLAELPPKNRIELWVEMTPEQERQYKQFEQEAEITISDYDLGSVGILAEYARLKQFAGAVQDVVVTEQATDEHPIKYRLVPTYDSPKLPQIWELMEGLGIPQKEPVDGEMQQMLIFSESTSMINMVTRWLNEQGVPSESLTGETPQSKRPDMVRRFQDGKFRVMCLNTKAAGVSINLDRANTAIFLDETWNPDDQEQAEDRIHRGSRIHQVTIYYIRTLKTIQEMIRRKTERKDTSNKVILKLRKPD